MIIKVCTTILAAAACVCAATTSTTKPSITTTAVTSWDYKRQGADWTVNKDASYMCLAPTSTKQSPVAIPATAELTKEHFHVRSVGGISQYFIEQRLKSIRIEPSGLADSLQIANIRYSLMYFDVRAASEHHIDGKQQPLEIQYVFQNVLKKKAVVSFLFASSALGVNQSIGLISALSTLGTSLGPSTAVKTTTGDTRYDALEELYYAALKTGASVITYDGSSTEPPCQEDVRWWVYNKPIIVDNALLVNIAQLVKYAGTDGNYRALPTGDLIKGVVYKKAMQSAEFVSAANVLSLQLSVVVTAVLSAAVLSLH